MKVLIYGTPTCGFCKKAICLANLHNIGVEYITVGKDVTREELLEAVGKPVRTVPQIFVSKSGEEYSYVGGYDEFKKMLESS